MLRPSRTFRRLFIATALFAALPILSTPAFANDRPHRHRVRDRVEDVRDRREDRRDLRENRRDRREDRRDRRENRRDRREDRRDRRH